MIKIAIKLTVIALVFVGFIFMAIVVIRCDKSNHFKPSNMYYYDDYKHVFSKKQKNIIGWVNFFQPNDISDAMHRSIGEINAMKSFNCIHENDFFFTSCCIFH